MVSDCQAPVVPHFLSRFRAFVKAHPVWTTAAAMLIALGLTALGLHLWAAYEYAQGERLVDRHEYVEAYPHYVNSLRAWRWSAQTHLVAGRAARRAGMTTEAEHHFERCLSLAGRDSPDWAAVKLERLLMQAQIGELRGIEAVLWDKVNRDAPEAPLILEAMARGYSRMFRLGEALKCLQMILERNPDNDEALYGCGWIADRSDGAMDALKYYRRALRVRPDRDDVRLALAKVLAKDDPKEAIGQFEQLKSRQPDNLEVLLGLAGAYQGSGRIDGLERAGELVEAVLQRDPENPDALTEKAKVMIASGQASEGEALLRRALANDPSNAPANFQLYQCLQAQPDREAEAEAQRAVFDRIKADRIRMAIIVTRDMSKRPFDPDLHYELGMIWYRNGKVDAGLRWITNALKLDPTHQPSLQALAEHFNRLGGDAANAEKHHPESSGETPKQEK